MAPSQSSVAPIETTMRITTLSLFVNLGLALVAGVGGSILGSKSLVADALHALGDGASDLLTVVAIYVAKTQLPWFPRAIKRIETHGTVVVNVSMFLGGLAMLIRSMRVLSACHSVHYSQDYDQNHTDIRAAWLALCSIVAKGYLYLLTRQASKNLESSILCCSALHYGADALGSVVVLCSIAATYFVGDIAGLDSIGGIMVSLMILASCSGDALMAVGKRVLRLARTLRSQSSFTAGPSDRPIPKTQKVD